MEKASTPRNRLTRSTAKQVNTSKSIEQEESVERSPCDDNKHNVRKTRRRYESKVKTNGDTANIENRTNNEDAVEDNTGDSCVQEESYKSQDSLKLKSQKTPSPTISRRSLRTRRSLTPGPELESSASKKIRRSSSFGILDLALTPTNRRGRRAKSESKDFVFTPSKDKQTGLQDSNTKYIPNAPSRIIEKIEEVNEGEKSSEDEGEPFEQESKALNCLESERNTEFIKKDDIAKHIELETVSEAIVQELDLAESSKTKLNESVIQNDSSSEKNCNGDKINCETDKETEVNGVNSKIVDTETEVDSVKTKVLVIESESNPEPCSLSIGVNNKAAELQEVDIKTAVNESESNLEPCSMSIGVNESTEMEKVNTKTSVSKSKLEPSLPIKVSKSPHASTVSDSIELSEIESFSKETVQSNDPQSESIAMELVNQNQEKATQQSVLKDEICENSNSEIQGSVETNETIKNVTDNIDYKSEGNSIEIDPDDDNEPIVSFKQLNEQLQSIMDENREESEEEIKTTFGKSNVEVKPQTQDEIENLEVSKIDLINSSDSEDQSNEERLKNSSATSYEDDKLCSKSKNFVVSLIEEVDFKNESVCKEIQLKTDTNLSGLKDSYVIDPKISGSHNYQDYEKVNETDLECKNTDEITLTVNDRDTISDQSKVDPIEVDLVKKTEDSELYLMGTESCQTLNITIENPHTIADEETVLDDSPSNVQENNVKDSIFKLKDQCPNLDNEHIIYEENDLQEKEVDDESCIRLNEQETNHPNTMQDKDLKTESEDNHDEYNDELSNENCEDEELNRSEEGSCDVYKGLSDSGSYVDEKGESSQFGESVSSELHSGPGDSEEEYATSGEEENIEEKNQLLKELSGSIEQKAKELLLCKNGDKPNEKNPDSPMTYDKALAIINKNRVKKIDDEEFFDMFTEELNRVSEESGSDSDIAIVDEYLMEPEEPTKKNQQKPGTAQNSKQPPGLAGPSLTHQSMPPENYPGPFNQPIHDQHGNIINQHGNPIPPQHTHSPMQRTNFTQDAMYQQFDQNIHLRGQLMYNQYAHSSSSLQDPHMFNPPVAHPDVNYSGGIFNHPPLRPVSESSFPPNSTSLKIRSVTDMNNVQSLGHKNYSNHDEDLLNTSEERIFERQEDKDKYLNMSLKTPAEIRQVDTSSSRPNTSETAKSPEFSNKKGNESRTPILDLLGLDEKALKLLKKVLGLNSIKRELMRRDLEWQKKCLEKNIMKSGLRQRGRKKETRYRNFKRSRESDSSSFNSFSEQSNEESSATSSGFGISKESNDGSSSENDNREVDIEDGSVYVTLKTNNKPRHRNKNEFFNFKRACRSGQISSETLKQKNKTKFRRKPRSSAEELSSKKMAQRQPTAVKSQCGTFTVDLLTASSQSSDSEVVSIDEDHQVQKMKRKMKQDFASGKNKLSNIFTQHSYKKTKESKKNASEPFQEIEIKGPLRKGNLKELRKLPSEILETLAKEDKKKKRHRTVDSDSGDVSERPKKIRKRSQKMRIKSKAGDQNYIPCVTGGATDFGLSRLSKDGALTLAEKAAKFRTDQLYGASVKRITSKELLNIKKKQNVNDSLTKKKKVE